MQWQHDIFFIQKIGEKAGRTERRNGNDFNKKAKEDLKNGDDFLITFSDNTDITTLDLQGVSITDKGLRHLIINPDLKSLTGWMTEGSLNPETRELLVSHGIDVKMP